MNVKRANGVFYTERSPFRLSPFIQWANSINLADKTILEPFAGANNIITMLKQIHLAKASASFDISPNSKDVTQRDTLANFPTGYEACITNPPWLARNSASRRGLPFPTDKYDDLYKHCLELCLRHCDYVGALIPASYLQSGLFFERLNTYILLHDILFDDTENPVCLALFDKQQSHDVLIYHDNELIGKMNELKQNTPQGKHNKQIRFNDPDGQLGFISFDNTKEPTIRFCDAACLTGYSIKQSSRFITCISGPFASIRTLVQWLNARVAEYRDETRDVFLTPFKGLRADGKYRRRMDFALARQFINAY